MAGRRSTAGGGRPLAAALVGALLCLLPSTSGAERRHRLDERPSALRDRASRVQRPRRLPPLLAASTFQVLVAEADGVGSGAPPPSGRPSRVYHVVDYGADPSGRNDSSEAISRAIADAFRPPSEGRTLLAGIPDLGGAEIHLDGGTYRIASPVRFPSSSGGNLKIHGGTLVASDDFPADGYLIELRARAGAAADSGGAAAGPSSGLRYEYITLRDLMLDANYRAGGVAVVDSLRISIDNCYVARFATDGVLVRGGHETYIRNCFLGQHITAGADPGEKNFTGVGINLDGNDNAVTDVVIFSAKTGVLVSGQANTLTGVHCYNKAAGWGGIGIHLRAPGPTQTRIVNCYLDYTGIVAEDPVQLLVSDSFFLGDAAVVLKSVQGTMKGVTIVDNVFSGGGKGAEIVVLDESSGKAFTGVEQVAVERNVARGMAARATTARGSAGGNGTTWEVDFSGVLLFPDRIDYVQYTLRPHAAAASGGLAAATLFDGHALRNVSGNRVVVESRSPMAATVHVTVDQSEGNVG